jgi:hypothetical protein
MPIAMIHMMEGRDDKKKARAIEAVTKALVESLEDRNGARDCARSAQGALGNFRQAGRPPARVSDALAWLPLDQGRTDGRRS